MPETFKSPVNIEFPATLNPPFNRELPVILKSPVRTEFPVIFNIPFNVELYKTVKLEILAFSVMKLREDKSVAENKLPPE